MIRYWLLDGKAGVVLTSITGPQELIDLALARDGNGGAANKAIIRGQGKKIPVGAIAFRDDWRAAWRPIEELVP